MINARKLGRTFQFRIPPGEDLYDYLTDFCINRRIRFGSISVIGAVEKATIGYYDQKKKKYYKSVLKEEFEVLSCNGNVSIKEGKPFLHLHIALSDTKLKALGGHLFPGTTVFVGEATIQEIKGKALTRNLDPAAGLPLWTCGQ
jgi:predicted DNA-binding protein with PD1-like motif